MPNRRVKQPSNQAEAPVVPNLHARKQEFVRNAIWDAAIDLFAEGGFDETTIDDIADAAGVSQRTFFRYFDSKADLMGKGTADLAVALSDAIEACPPSFSLSETMREAVLKVANQAAAYPRLEKLIQIAAKYPGARQAQASYAPEIETEIAQAYARRMKQPRKSDITPRVMAAITTSLFHVALHTWLERGRGDIEATVDEVLGATRRVLA